LIISGEIGEDNRVIENPSALEFSIPSTPGVPLGTGRFKPPSLKLWRPDFTTSPEGALAKSGRIVPLNPEVSNRDKLQLFVKVVVIESELNFAGV